MKSPFTATKPAIAPLTGDGGLPAALAENKGSLVDPKTTGVAVVVGAGRMLFHPPASVEVYDDVDALDTVGSVDEKSGKRELSIFRLLQSGSPQVKKGPNKVEGVEEGDIINTATGQIYSGEQGLYMIPVRAYQKFVEYKKRDKQGEGGGFLAIYEADNPYVGTWMEKYRKEHNMDPGAKIYDTIPSGLTPAEEDRPGWPKQLVETWYIDSIFIVPNEDGTCPGELGTVFEGSFAFSSTLISEYVRFDKRLSDMKYNVKRGEQIVPTEVVPWAHIWHIKTVSHPKSTAAQSWMTTRMTWAAKDEKGTELPYRSSRLPKHELLYKQAQKLFSELLEGNIGHAYAKDRVDEAPTQQQNGDEGEDGPFRKID